MRSSCMLAKGEVSGDSKHILENPMRIIQKPCVCGSPPPP